ncbi:MAG: glycine--tRNA ligase [Methanomassiliicoccales archaeon]|nr:glycine--tRNA ligase [Methanomassiliicoccales archaeon]
MNSADILSLCKRRGFIWPSYEIYGGIAGLYDYGPLGTAMKNNIMNAWRRAYILGEGFVEIDSDTIGPEAVFKASGHVDQFADKLVTCTNCKTPFRADHLLKDVHPNPGVLSLVEIDEQITLNNVVCPDCGGKLSKAEDFNLMFKTTIGPGSAGRTGFLRPETAQGIFVNFNSLYRYNRERLPFGVIQVGRGYRNEISPRQGVIRLREFNMMEAELFVDPKDKTWPRYDAIKGDMLSLVPNEPGDKEIEISLEEAVKRKIIANETLAYFLWFTQRFLVSVGVDPERLRFRQHLKNEMAHYAADCWDAEALLSFGWTEVVGVADRGCWDLSRHIEFSKADLTAFRRYETPTEVEKDVIKPKFGALGPLFKSKASAVGKALESTDVSQAGPDGIEVVVDGERIWIAPNCYEVTKAKEKVTGEKVVPHVIEPSHGLDRILYTCLEHAYTEREDKEGKYLVLRLTNVSAPIKVGVFPLMGKEELVKIAASIDAALRSKGVDTSYDDSGSIGRRYARMDEVGTPYCVTVDFTSVEQGTVTLRDRDTTEQVRIRTDELLPKLSALLSHEIEFSDLKT